MRNNKKQQKTSTSQPNEKEIIKIKKEIYWLLVTCYRLTLTMNLNLQFTLDNRFKPQQMLEIYVEKLFMTVGNSK